jgi:hypothetical protein
MLSRPDSEEEAGDGHGSSQPEWPKAFWPDLEVKPVERNASYRQEDDRYQEKEGAQDARGSWLQTLGGFGIYGFDRPVNKKEDPDYGKETFIEPEHSRPSVAKVAYSSEQTNERSEGCLFSPR